MYNFSVSCKYPETTRLSMVLAKTWTHISAAVNLGKHKMMPDICQNGNLGFKVRIISVINLGTYRSKTELGFRGKLHLLEVGNVLPLMRRNVKLC